MKVILDSNIYIAAFSSRGICSSLFQLCLDRVYIIISEDLLSEVSRNLSKKLKLPDDKINEIISYLREERTLINYKKLDKRICRDADDDNILALARDGGVDYIITGDKDLLVLEEFESVPIVDPRGFWDILRKNRK